MLGSTIAVAAVEIKRTHMELDRSLHERLQDALQRQPLGVPLFPPALLDDIGEHLSARTV